MLMQYVHPIIILVLVVSVVGFQRMYLLCNTLQLTSTSVSLSRARMAACAPMALTSTRASAWLDTPERTVKVLALIFFRILLNFQIY